MYCNFYLLIVFKFLKTIKGKMSFTFNKKIIFKEIDFISIRKNNTIKLTKIKEITLRTALTLRYYKYFFFS